MSDNVFIDKPSHRYVQAMRRLTPEQRLRSGDAAATADQHLAALRTLVSNNVTFVLLGQVAASLQGLPNQAHQLEILVEVSADNLTRVDKALSELNVGTSAPVKVVFNTPGRGRFASSYEDATKDWGIHTEVETIGVAGIPVKVGVPGMLAANARRESELEMELAKDLQTSLDVESAFAGGDTFLDDMTRVIPESSEIDDDGIDHGRMQPIAVAIGRSVLLHEMKEALYVVEEVAGAERGKVLHL